MGPNYQFLFSEQEEKVDVNAVKNIMANLVLPPTAIPSWGKQLTDNDFINVIRATISDKKSKTEKKINEEEKKS